MRGRCDDEQIHRGSDCVQYERGPDPDRRDGQDGFRLDDGSRRGGPPVLSPPDRGDPGGDDDGRRGVRRRETDRWMGQVPVHERRRGPLHLQCPEGHVRHEERPLLRLGGCVGQDPVHLRRAGTCQAHHLQEPLFLLRDDSRGGEGGGHRACRGLIEELIR